MVAAIRDAVKGWVMYFYKALASYGAMKCD